MHQFVIHELGPLLTDQRVSRGRAAAPGRRAAAPGAQPGAPRAHRRRAPAARAVGHRRRARLRADRPAPPRRRRITEVMVNGPTTSTSSAAASIEHDRRAVRRRDAPAPHHRQDREPGRPARRRGEPDGRRPPPRRLPCERRRPPARDRRAVHDDPKVLQGPVHGRRPHQLRLVHAAGRALHRPVRARPPEHRGQRRYRYREDDAAQRAVVASSRPTSASSRSRTPRSSSSTRTHVLPLEARPPNIEGKGEVKIRDLVRNSLRMRPDRIVVGEVRGGEALDMLQAMNTGHDGSITTVHSNSPRDTLSRIETMTLMAGMDLPVRVIREQMASALDLIVHLTRLRDGTRRVTHVSEVMGMEGDVVVLQDIYTVRLRRWASTRTAGSAAASRAPASARRSPSSSPTTASRSSRRCSPTRCRRAATVGSAMNDRWLRPRGAAGQPGEDRLRACWSPPACSGSASRSSSCRATTAGKIEQRLGDLMQEPTPDERRGRRVRPDGATRRSPRPR